MRVATRIGSTHISFIAKDYGYHVVPIDSLVMSEEREAIYGPLPSPDVREYRINDKIVTYRMFCTVHGILNNDSRSV